MAYIKITLLSDLCAASGEANGNSIDTEIAVSNNGIPYIPARRIKGCLRETAEELIKLGYEEINNTIVETIFGNAFGIEGIFSIDDAKIKGDDSINNYLNILKNDNEALPVIKEYAKARNVEKIFSTVRGRTQIKDGIAVDNSLRYVRVLNKYNPLVADVQNDSVPMEFYASVYVDGSIEQKNNAICTIKKLCKATRHIGLNRNRGLGNVRMEYIENNEPNNILINLENLDTNNRVVFTYYVSNVSPLTMSTGSEYNTCIPSRSVIGNMVGAYLKDNSPETDEFKDLFLNGTTIWSSLNPVIDGVISSKTPLILMKLKNDNNRYINKELMSEDEWDKAKSLKPKTLDDMYSSIIRKGGYTKCLLAKPATHDVYHNSVKNQELYMQTSMDAGYIFGGTVETDGKYAKVIQKLLERSSIRFGRSKSAQYSSCIMLDKTSVSVKEYSNVDISPNERFYVILKSDLVIDNAGLYETNNEFIKSYLLDKFNLGDAILPLEDASCNYGVLSGYNTSWQLLKPRIPCVKAGSVYSFIAKESISIPTELVLGEYIQEGMGNCKIISEKQMQEINLVEKACVDRSVQEGDANILSSFISNIRVHAAKETIKKYARDFKVSSSNIPISRLRLMLSEASDIEDLRRLVTTIKESDKSSENQKTKKIATIEIVETIYGKENVDWENLLSYEPGLWEEIKSDRYALELLKYNWKMPLEQILHAMHYRKGGE